MILLSAPRFINHYLMENCACQQKFAQKRQKIEAICVKIYRNEEPKSFGEQAPGVCEALPLKAGYF
jgi:hypothetical protein